MKTINEQSAGQNHYMVSSKNKTRLTVGVWADNKTEAKKIFKAANPTVASKDITPIIRDGERFWIVCRNCNGFDRMSDDLWNSGRADCYFVDSLK